MLQVLLLRFRESDQGTFGSLIVPHAGFSCYMGELPWHDNIPSFSCIPSGDYQCIIRQSPRYGFTYHVQDVPKRSYILMHGGNLCGDTRRGFRTHSRGCLLFGKTTGRLSGQDAVLNSKATMLEFMNVMDREPFLLRIRRLTGL